MPPHTWPEPWHVVLFVVLVALGLLAIAGTIWDLRSRAPGAPRVVTLAGPEAAPGAPRVPALDQRHAIALSLLLDGTRGEDSLRRELARRGAVYTATGFRYVMQQLVDAGLVRRETLAGDWRYYLTDDGFDVAAGIAPEDAA